MSRYRFYKRRYKKGLCLRLFCLHFFTAIGVEMLGQPAQRGGRCFIPEKILRLDRAVSSLSWLKMPLLGL